METKKRLNTLNKWTIQSLALTSLLGFNTSTLAAPCQDSAINFNEHSLQPYTTTNTNEQLTVLEDGCALLLAGNTYVLLDKTIEITPNTVLNLGFQSSENKLSLKGAAGIALIPLDKIEQLNAEHHHGYQLTTYGKPTQPYGLYGRDFLSASDFDATHLQQEYVNIEIPVGLDPIHLGPRQLAIFVQDDEDINENNLSAYFNNIVFSEKPWPIESLHEDVFETPDPLGCHTFGNDIKTTTVRKPGDRHFSQNPIAQAVGECGIYLSETQFSQDTGKEYTIYPDTVISFYFEFTTEFLGEDADRYTQVEMALDSRKTKHYSNGVTGFRFQPNFAIPLISGGLWYQSFWPNPVLITNFPHLTTKDNTLYVKDYPIGQLLAYEAGITQQEHMRLSFRLYTDDRQPASAMFDQIQIKRAGWWKGEGSKPPSGNIPPYKNPYLNITRQFSLDERNHIPES